MLRGGDGCGVGGMGLKVEVDDGRVITVDRRKVGRYGREGWYVGRLTKTTSNRKDIVQVLILPIRGGLANKQSSLSRTKNKSTLDPKGIVLVERMKSEACEVASSNQRKA